MQNGSWLHSWSASWPARFFCTLCFIALLLPGLRSFASEQNDLMDSLQWHLETTLVQLTSLENELTSWKLLSAESELQAQRLSQELAELRSELETWQTASIDSQKQVEALRASLAKSEAKLTQVSKILRDSADSWKQVADAERRVLRKWKFATILVGAGALLAGGAAGYFLGK